jgi:hypothetical protein
MAAKTPIVELGRLQVGGVAPAIMAIVDRAAARRPDVVSGLRAEIELSIEERYPPVRIVFGGDAVLVEDGPALEPDLRITGTLPDLVSLMVAPLLGGVPNPIDRRGRAVLGMLAQRRVRLDGRLSLLRQFLAVIQI